jgi:hypothetical protein
MQSPPSVFQEANMVLRGMCSAALCAALILACSSAWAADYRPDQFLGLDLSKVALSPKLLGPPTTFEKVPIEAKSEASGVLDPKDARKVAVERVKAAPARVAKRRVAKRRPPRHHKVAHARHEKPRRLARGRLVHRRHANPLNAEAMAPPILKWPCNPGYGGICTWRR